MMRFSAKQRRVLTWWRPDSPDAAFEAIICDGAVRSGKTLCMGLSFFLWASACYSGARFGLCGKTIASLRRNVVTELLPKLQAIGFSVRERRTENLLQVSYRGHTNEFYLFGGRDEGSAALIQGITFAGVLLDEVALMPRSFVEQACARCSVTGSRLWFNCNPEGPYHWFYTEWIGHAAERNCLYLHFTMEDNPSLSEDVRKRYRTMFSGAFYSRFIEGKWTAATGLIYPFALDLLCEVPKADFERYAVSIDYGTVNPTSMGLWGLLCGVWYRVDEYYFDARLENTRRTDEEHFKGFLELIRGRTPDVIVCDPSAASFITLLQSRGFAVTAAKNDVLNGIRMTATALRTGQIKVTKGCVDAVREFSLYRWADDGARDVPVKENDHAMDDIRYFVSTVLGAGESFACAVQRETGKGVSIWDF